MLVVAKELFKLLHSLDAFPETCPLHANESSPFSYFLDHKELHMSALGCEFFSWVEDF